MTKFIVLIGALPKTLLLVSCAVMTNARAEDFNTTIQKIERDAQGFRNKERFKAAIYFHLGGLDLYPEAVRK